MAKGGTELVVALKQQFQDSRHTLGRFRIAVTDAPRPLTFGVSPAAKSIFAISPEKRNDGHKKQLQDIFKKTDSKRANLDKALAEARKPLPVDPKLTELQDKVNLAKTPVIIPDRIARLRRDLDLSKGQLGKKRLVAAQDIAWALINTPAFLFNR